MVGFCSIPIQLSSYFYIFFFFEERPLSSDEIVALCFGLFIGGFETSSNTLSFTLYYLAKHQQYQNKAREEVNAVLKKYNNEIGYDAVQEMKYVQQCIDGKYLIILRF